MVIHILLFAQVDLSDGFKPQFFILLLHHHFYEMVSDDFQILVVVLHK